jgi:hypothetical protein
LAARSSASDEPTHRRCNASEQLCQRIFNLPLHLIDPTKDGV